MSGQRFHERIIPKIQKLDSRSMQSVIQHLAKEHGFLETIFNTVCEAILVIDSAHRIIYHNSAAKAMLGLPENLDLLRIDKLLRDVNWNEILPADGDVANPGKVVRQELQLSYPERRIVQFYAMPLSSDPSKYVIILNDITAFLDKATNQAEDERGKMVSMLAAGVAHEIGNPLNSLYLHLQLSQRLARDCQGNDELTEELAEARKEIERLDAIINQFLHAIRPGKPQFQVLDLKTLVLEALSFMRHEIAGREVKVDFFWGDNVPLVSGDPVQLKQAFYNLVKNAIQSMKNGGSLGIRCEADDERILLTVSDSGCGIKKENLAKIFTPYFTTKGTGTGLGLMIVERIVREHGATLSCDSKEGAGTTFTITFPRRERMVKVLPAPASTNHDGQTAL